MNLDNLNKQELKDLLKDLSLYKKLISELGQSRGKKVFENKKNGKNNFLVEYFPNIDKAFVLEEAKKIYEKNFSQKNLKDEEIILKENKKILGGIKIFFNDDLIDMSFLKISQMVKK